jgi:hypothetical protein
VCHQSACLLTPPGKVLTCQWTCDGESSGSISVVVRDGSITLPIGWARTVNRLDETSIRGAQAMVRLPALFGRAANFQTSRDTCTEDDERWREKHEAAVAKSWSGFWGSRLARRLGLGRIERT